MVVLPTLASSAVSLQLSVGKFLGWQERDCYILVHLVVCLILCRMETPHKHPNQLTLFPGTLPRFHSE